MGRICEGLKAFPTLVPHNKPAKMAKFLATNPQYQWMGTGLTYVNTRPVARGSHEFYSATPQTPENMAEFEQTLEWYRKHEPWSNL